MDVNILRSIITLVSFLAFVGIIVWAWSSRNRARFDKAANAVLDDDLIQPGEHK